MENVKTEKNFESNSSQQLSNSPKHAKPSEKEPEKHESWSLKGDHGCDPEVILLPTPEKPKPLLITIDDSEESKSTPKGPVNKAKDVSSAASTVKETQNKDTSAQKRSTTNTIESQKKSTGNRYTAKESQRNDKNMGNRSATNAKSTQKKDIGNKQVCTSNKSKKSKKKKLSRWSVQTAASMKTGLLPHPPTVTLTNKSSISVQNKDTNIPNQNRYKPPSRWDQVYHESNYFRPNISEGMIQYPVYDAWNVMLPTYSTFNTNFQYGLFPNNNIQYGVCHPSASSNNFRYTLDAYRFTSSNYLAVCQNSANVRGRFNYGNNVNKNRQTINKLIDSHVQKEMLNDASHQNTSVNNLKQAPLSNVSTNTQLPSSQQSFSSASSLNQLNAANYSEKENSDAAAELPSHQNISLLSNLNQPLESDASTDKNCSIPLSSSQQYASSDRDLHQLSVASCSEKEKSNDAVALSSHQNVNLVNLNQPLLSDVSTDKNCTISLSSSQQYASSDKDLHQLSVASCSEKEKSNDAAELPYQNMNLVNNLNQPLVTDVNTDKSFNVSQLSSSQQDSSSVVNLNLLSATNYLDEKKSNDACQVPFDPVCNSNLPPLVFDVNTDKNCNVTHLTSSQQCANSVGNLNPLSSTNYLESETPNDNVHLSSQQNTNHANLSQSLASNINPVNYSNLLRVSNVETDKGLSVCQFSSSQQYTNSGDLLQQSPAHISSTDKNHSNTNELPCLLNANNNSLEYCSGNHIKDVRSNHSDNAMVTQTISKVSFPIKPLQKPTLLNTQLASDSGLTESNSNELKSKQVSKIVQKPIIVRIHQPVVPNKSSNETAMSLKPNSTASVQDKVLGPSGSNMDINFKEMCKITQSSIEYSSPPVMYHNTNSSKATQSLKLNYNNAASVKNGSLEPSGSKEMCTTVNKPVMQYSSSAILYYNRSSSKATPSLKLNYNNAASMKNGSLESSGDNYRPIIAESNTSAVLHPSSSSSPVTFNLKHNRIASSNETTNIGFVAEKRKNTFEANTTSKKQKNCGNSKSPYTSKQSEQEYLSNKPPNFPNNAKLSNCVPSVLLPASQQTSLSSGNEAEDTNSKITNNVKVRKDCTNVNESVIERTMRSCETSNMPLHSNMQNLNSKFPTRNMTDKGSVGSVCNKSAVVSGTERDVPSSSLVENSENLSSKNDFEDAVKKIFNLEPYDQDYRQNLPRDCNLLLEELSILDSHEETIEQGMLNIKSKIKEYTTLIKKCRTGETKLCVVKEDIKKKRNYIKSLLKCIKKKNSVNKKNLKRVSQICSKDKKSVRPVSQNVNSIETDNTSEVCQAPLTPVSQSTSLIQENEKSVATVSSVSTSLELKQHQISVRSTCKDSGPSTASGLPEGQNIESTSVSQECDEITILPTPNKQPLVITLDDEEENTIINQCNKNSNDNTHRRFVF